MVKEINNVMNMFQNELRAYLNKNILRSLSEPIGSLVLKSTYYPLYTLHTRLYANTRFICGQQERKD